MRDPYISESEVQCYILGLLSPEAEDWIELCYDSDPRLQELFRKHNAVPFHHSMSPDLNADCDEFDDDDGHLSNTQLLAEIRREIEDVDALLSEPGDVGAPLQVVETVLPINDRESRIKRPHGKGFMAREKTASTPAAGAQGKAAGLTSSAAHPTSDLKAEYELLPGTSTSQVTLQLSISGQLAKNGIFVEITGRRNKRRENLAQNCYPLPEIVGGTRTLRIPIEGGTDSIDVEVVPCDLS
jgi:hypothetical protein